MNTLKYLSLYTHMLVNLDPTFDVDFFREQLECLANGKDENLPPIVVTVLLRFYHQMRLTHPEIGTEVLSILGNCRKTLLVDILSEAYYTSLDPALLEVLPKNEFWELAEEITPFSNFTKNRYAIQRGIEQVFVSTSQQRMLILSDLLSAYTLTPDPQLRARILTVLQNMMQSAQRFVTDISPYYEMFSKCWANTGDQELLKLIPASPYRKIALQLVEYISESIYYIEQNIISLVSHTYFRNDYFLHLLTRCYANTDLPHLKASILHVLNKIASPRLKYYIINLWEKNNLDTNLIGAISNAEIDQLAEVLLGKIHLTSFVTKEHVRIALLSFKMGRTVSNEQDAFFRFALSAEDRELRLKVLTLINFSADASTIIAWWLSTHHPDLELFLPQDDYWVLAKKLFKFLPGRDLYQLWRDLHNYVKYASEPQVSLTKDLLKVVALHKDADFCSQALEILRRTKNVHNIREICLFWFETRHSVVEQLLIQQKLHQKWNLLLDNTEKSVTTQIYITVACKFGSIHELTTLSNRELSMLVEATLDKDATMVAKNAIARLEAFDSTYLSQFAELWRQTRVGTLLSIMQAKNYLPVKPLETRLVMAILLNQLEDVIFDKPELVSILVELAEQDNLNGQRARQLLAKLKKIESQQALCRLLIESETDLPRTQAIAMQMNIVPSELAQKAIYYFLTEQWAKYEELDFDRRYLATGYRKSNVAQKRRLANKVRASGNIEYLEVFGLGGANSQAQAHAETQIEMLATVQSWAKLWSLVLELPFVWSVKALKVLQQNGSGWHPETPEENQLFNKLIDLLDKKLNCDEQEILNNVPLAYQQLRVNIKTDKVTNLAFSPVQPLLAMATDAKVILWNLQEAKVEQLLEVAEQKVSGVAFTPDGTLIYTGTNINYLAESKVYARSKTGELRTIGEHSAGINFLMVVDNRRILTGGQSADVHMWDIETSKCVATYHNNKNSPSYNWIVGACLSSDKKQVVLLGKEITYLGLPGLQPQVASNRTTAEFGVFSPDDNALVINRNDGNLRIYARKANGEYGSRPTVLDGIGLQKNPVKGLAVLGELNLLVVARRNGEIELLDWATYASTGKFRVKGRRINSITLSPDATLMAVGEDASHFSVWDLGTLRLRRLLQISWGQAQIEDLTAISRLFEKGLKLPSAVHNSYSYIKTLLEYRLAFNIELDRVIFAQASDFDIEF